MPTDRYFLKYLLKIKIAAPDKLLVLVGEFGEKTEIRKVSSGAIFKNLSR